MQKTDVCTASNSPQTVHRALAGDEMLYCRTLPLEDLEAGDEGCGLGNWALGGSAMVWRDCSRGQCATVSIFDGRVVAKLPFIPISWLQGLSHRNLMGDDYTDCSFIFLYILCTMSIRQNIQKLLGFAPSRAANKHSTNLFGPQPQQFSAYK
ncbi:putative transmembrane and coiled-coil domain-containing protein 1 isoform X2 [Penaeus vannamei]|uniref:Putative transmembrane and coiled-coil domain-containing protein 1 isoform X2 n=1 Tax=Penaeus vannamei TaxID=6689 RepID=A0A423TXX7_PENVA|nr:putative transmembrane and coiled-coil domain-containing protein 1 isoform X2 [Penaeus vannamei]